LIVNLCFYLNALLFFFLKIWLAIQPVIHLSIIVGVRKQIAETLGDIALRGFHASVYSAKEVGILLLLFVVSEKWQTKRPQITLLGE